MLCLRFPEKMVTGMVGLKSTTLVCIDTDNDVLAQAALVHSARCCSFDRVLYLSDVEWAVPSFDFIRINRLAGIDDYNKLVLKDLFHYIETDYILIIQFDGFIVRPDRWDDAFFQYDYIGAPWPQHRENAVGNGGFSLRSRRLLKALQDPEIPSSLEEGEDSMICRHYRDYLEEKYGIRFPSRDVALRFSHEIDPCPPDGSFGFHGLINTADLYQGIDPSFFIDNLGPANLKGRSIFILVAWYNEYQLWDESRRLLNRISAVQTEQEMEMGYRNVGLRPHACEQIALMLGTK